MTSSTPIAPRLMTYLHSRKEPATLTQMAQGLNEDVHQVSKVLAILFGQGQVVLALDGFRYEPAAGGYAA